MSDAVLDFSTLSMTEIIRLQNLLSQELTRRFERHVALAFSDIVGSTAYFALFGDEAGRRLQQLHLDLLNECLPAHGGRIVDTAGDGAFLAFPTADAAVDTLIDLQKAVSRENTNRARDHQLQVRVGIHWGPVLTDGTAVTGDAVNLCARVAATSSVGEIRLTREVFQEIALNHRLNCRFIGPTELKGIVRQVELMALDWRDRTLFPSLCRVEETRQEIALPSQDIISFGRLREHEGTLANDIVLALADPTLTRQLSRWHFEIRRFPDGYRLRSVTDGITEVNGEPVARGQEVAIQQGTVVRLAKVMTLTFLSPYNPGVPADATMIANG